MLHQSGGARIEAPRQGGRCVGPVMSLTAVSLLALVSAAGFAPAQAADLNGKVSTIQNEEEFGFRKPEVFDWSGVYVGAHLGAAWGDLPRGETIVDESVVVESVRGDSELEGSLAGGHLGFNHQFGRWVGGAEVSLSGGDVEASQSARVSFDGESFEGHAKTEIDDLFLATVRLGYAFDRTLAYVKAGYASADVKVRAEIDDMDVSVSSSERHAGFTIGGGIEYALTKGVIFGLEYNRVDLGDTTHVAFAKEDGDVVGAAPVRVEPDVLHVAMARLSLKFGDDGAVLPAMLK
jgi:outer membrane immunogenic protein